MAPTRELAKQVADTFSDVAGSLSIVCVYGGTPIGPQGNEFYIENSKQTIPGLRKKFKARNTDTLRAL